MKFEERLKALRKQVGETQPELAKAIGISTKQVVRFEHGEQKPGFDNLWALADHFKVTVDFLMAAPTTDRGRRRGGAPSRSRQNK